MRILVLSDLHLEFGPWSWSLPTAVDVVVLAGDVDYGVRSVEWASAACGETPVVLVPGNHELYRGAHPRTLERMRAAARGTRVHVLDGEALTLGGVTFLGATLWTDYALTGDRDRAILACAEAMTDYQAIRVSPRLRKLSPRHVQYLHNIARRWLESCFPAERPTVVVTHHAPSRRSLADLNEGDLAAAYATDLEEVVCASRARCWIHGHVHRSADYLLGETRVLCNPRGYPDDGNAAFRADLVITI